MTDRVKSKIFRGNGIEQHFKHAHAEEYYPMVKEHYFPIDGLFDAGLIGFYGLKDLSEYPVKNDSMDKYDFSHYCSLCDGDDISQVRKNNKRSWDRACYQAHYFRAQRNGTTWTLCRIFASVESIRIMLEEVLDAV